MRIVIYKSDLQSYYRDVQITLKNKSIFHRYFFRIMINKMQDINIFKIYCHFLFNILNLGLCLSPNYMAEHILKLRQIIDSA